MLCAFRAPPSALGRLRGWFCGGGGSPLSLTPPGLLLHRYLKQVSELTFPQEAQLRKLNKLKAYNLEAEMHSLR